MIVDSRINRDRNSRGRYNLGWDNRDSHKWRDRKGRDNSWRDNRGKSNKKRESRDE